ncbi:MAG: protease SohB [Legionella sp.]|jgi:serine protease SohB
MEFLSQYGLFLLKSITIVIAILMVVAGVFAINHKPKPKMEIKSLNEEYSDVKSLMHKTILKDKLPKPKKSKEKKPTLYVIEFDGDMKASQVEQLREEVTAVLSIAEKNDEVLIKLESPGGSVNGYGLAAAQLQRIRDTSIPLTVCIDKVAASGGYLMACVANTIIAAPFAIIGSIGVVAQIPNFHKWLKNNDIDVELLTAGEYKRTLTLFGENTPAGRKKFQEDLEKIHTQFRNYVLTNRSNLDIEKVATGEHWLASDAFALKLVDRLLTSDEYLINKMVTHQAFKLSIKPKMSLINKLLKPAMRILHPWG